MEVSPQNQELTRAMPEYPRWHLRADAIRVRGPFRAHRCCPGRSWVSAAPGRAARSVEQDAEPGEAGCACANDQHIGSQDFAFFSQMCHPSSATAHSSLQPQAFKLVPVKPCVVPHVSCCALGRGLVAVTFVSLSGTNQHFESCLSLPEDNGFPGMISRAAVEIKGSAAGLVD